MEEYTNQTLNIDLLKEEINNESEPEEEDLKQKRIELIEEYKILQTKLDTYGSATLRLRSIIFPLIPAVLFFAYNISLNTIVTKSLIFGIILYLVYSEVLSYQAKDIFQKRIKKIEDALKDVYLLKNIEIFDIVKCSSEIGKEMKILIPHFWKKINIYKKALGILFVLIYIIIFFDLNTKEQSEKPQKVEVAYNLKIDMIKEKNDINSSNTFQKIENELIMNNEILQDIRNCCFNTSDK